MPVKSYTMTNKNRLEITVISWGATIVSLKYPDKFGRVADVVLGFDDLKSTNPWRNYIFIHDVHLISSSSVNSTHN